MRTFSPRRTEQPKAIGGLTPRCRPDRRAERPSSSGSRSSQRSHLIAHAHRWSGHRDRVQHDRPHPGSSLFGRSGAARPTRVTLGGVVLGRTPNCPDRVQRLAYSHEWSSCGFRPGGSTEGSFYSYAPIRPPGLSEPPVEYEPNTFCPRRRQPERDGKGGRVFSY